MWRRYTPPCLSHARVLLVHAVLTPVRARVLACSRRSNRKFCVDTSVQHKWLEVKQLALYHHVHCAERMAEGTSVEALTAWLGGMVDQADGQYVLPRRRLAR